MHNAKPGAITQVPLDGDGLENYPSFRYRHPAAAPACETKRKRESPHPDLRCAGASGVLSDGQVKLIRRPSRESKRPDSIAARGSL